MRSVTIWAIGFLLSSLFFLAMLEARRHYYRLQSTSDTAVNKHLIALSVNLLEAVKGGKSIDSIQDQLLNYRLKDLIKGLPNDQSKKVFWINLYNAGYQILASEEQTPEDIFTAPAIQFRDLTLSLDEIEHGVLRQYRWKYGLGYLPQWFPSKAVVNLAVNKIDYRIHFALNCGARSCPAISIYRDEELSDQLDNASRHFISGNTIVDRVNQTIEVSRIFNWFIADFGGKAGVKKIVGSSLNQDFSNYTVVYSEYDWTPYLMNFE